MLLLLLLGVAVLYACFRNDWLLLLLLPILGTYAVAGSSVHANVDAASCSQVSSALQKKFPLCWMMSAIGLLNNLMVLHKFEFLHPHVIALINKWKSLPYPAFSARDAACPLITPKELRSHLTDWHGALNRVEVNIFMNVDEYFNFLDVKGEICIKRDERKFVPESFGSSIKSFFKWLTTASDKSPPLDEPVPPYKTLGWGPREHPSFVLKQNIQYDTTYDDPLVQDYLKGKHWFYQYPVCVTKFTGWWGGVPLMYLLDYKASYVESFITETGQLVWIGKTEKYYICSIRNADALRIDVDLRKYDNLPVVVLLRMQNLMSHRPALDIPWPTINNIRADSISGYTILGGVLGCKNHAIHFVICDGSIRFVDSNSSTIYYSLEDVLKKYKDIKKCSSADIIMVKDSQRKRKRSDEEEEGRRV